jgi:hypothetical protein
MFKEHIVKALKWALSKFEPKPTLKDKLAAWPFPGVSEDFNPRPCEKKPKPRVATTRKVAVKKTVKKAK